MPITGNNGFIDLGTITSRTETAGYSDDNVGTYWHLKRRFRANDANNNDWLLKFNFGAVKTVSAVVLNDVNFNAVKIQGHGEDVWTDPDYPGSDVVVSRDERVNRYKIYIPLTGFSNRWMRIFIPEGTGPVGSYLGKWEVGSVVVLESTTQIIKNTYSRTSVRKYRDIALPSGDERVNLGEIGWEGVIGFDVRKESDETSLWELNNVDSANPLVIYEDNDDTSKVYICLRDDAYEGNLIYHGVAQGNMIKFKELV